MGVKINFDLSKLEGAIRKEAVKQLEKSTFDTTCPNCSNSISVRVGKNHCSICGSEIDYKLNSNL